MSEAERASDTTKDNPWPLSVYSRRFSQYIQKAPPAWIEAEVVSLKRYRNAAYMKLKDLNDDAFLPASSFVDAILSKVDTLKEGSKVVMYARPAFWVKRGEVSMTLMDVHELGAGDMLLRIEELRKKLAQEGVFAPEHKQELPFLPRKVGLICGKNAQAKDDVLENAYRRWPSIAFEIREVSVGNSPSTPREVIAALGELDAMEDVDVIIISRGGGALEEVVFPFSDEALVRAVFAAKTPVVSAIGHETDQPLIDFVADFRASTPTDAAKNIVPDIRVELELIDQLESDLKNALLSKIEHEMSLLESLTSRPVLKTPGGILEPKLQEFSELTKRLRASFEIALERESGIFEGLWHKIMTLNPSSTLERGYAIVYSSGVAKSSVNDFKVGETIQIQMKDGQLESSIKEINER
jgi:exodeoxyribonuclease VII large subunit